MRVLLGLIGAGAGIWAGSADTQVFFFVATGVAAGVAIGWLLELSAEVRALRHLSTRDMTPDARAVRPPPPPPEPPSAAAPTPPVPPPSLDDARRWDAPVGVPSPKAGDAGPLAAPMRAAVAWLLSGNLPVKVGVLVSFFGVAFLLKYAVDHQLLRVPIELRLAAVAAGGIALVAFGWRLRERMRAYAISIQGGGIGILYLVIYAAFRLFALIPAGAAFAVLVALMAFAGWLAWVQRAQALAVLGSVGGFLAPLLASTGDGSHVALFGYYLVLNAAIFGLAWVTAWRWLNLIGFAFTFVIGSWWAHAYYRPQYFASTQPFLAAFFVIYAAIPALYALKQPPRLRGVVDSTLVFGMPVLALPLQAGLMRGSEYGMAYSALAAAGLYAVLAAALRRAAPGAAALLVECYVGLSLAFATLAIPLALDAQWTAGAWALEGAAAMWIGVRQRRVLLRFAGAALVVAAGIAHIVGADAAGAEIAVLNGRFLSGFLVGAASLIAAAQLGHEVSGRHAAEPGIRVLVFGWGVAWWLATGLVEIQAFIPDGHRFDAAIIYLAAVVWAGARVSQWLGQRLFAVGVPAWLPLLGVLLAVSVVGGAAHPFARAGWAAWLIAIAVHFDGVRRAEALVGGARERWWSAGLWLVAALLVLEARWLVGEALSAGDGWRTAAAFGAVALVAVGSMRIATHRDPHAWLHFGALPLVAAAAAVLVVQNLVHAGSAAPLPYLPLLNPMDAAAVGALVLSLRWLGAALPSARWEHDTRQVAFVLYGVLAWYLLTFAVVRASHHFGVMAYTVDAAIRSMTLQAALSLAWGVAALACMVIGARLARRTLWIGGAVLMAVVVGKLFLLDLGNTGTVERIVSFLGVGALLLVVGYWAPVPGRPSRPA